MRPGLPVPLIPRPGFRPLFAKFVKALFGWVLATVLAPLLVAGCLAEDPKSPLEPATPRLVDTSLIGIWIGADTMRDGQFRRTDSIYLTISRDSMGLFVGTAKRCDDFADPKGLKIPICPDDIGSVSASTKFRFAPYSWPDPQTIQSGSTIIEYWRIDSDTVEFAMLSSSFAGEYGNIVPIKATKRSAVPTPIPMWP